MRAVVSLFALCVLLAQSPESPAQPQTPAMPDGIPVSQGLNMPELPAQSETLASLSRQLIERSPWAARWQKQEAQAAAEVQAALPIPQLSLSLDAQLRPGAQEQSARVGYTLPSPRQQQAQLLTAQARQTEQQALVSQEKLEQLLRLHRLGYQALALQVQLNRLPERIDVLERLEQVAQQRADAGLISHLDALRLQGEAAQLKGQQARTQAELLTVLVSIQGLLGLQSPVRLEGSLVEPLPLPTPELLQQQLLQHPQLRAHQAEQQAQQARVQGLTVGGLPEALLQGAQVEAGLWRVADGTSGPLGLGLAFSMPLTSSRIRQQQQGVEQARLEGLEVEQAHVLQQAQVLLTGAQLQRAAEQDRVKWLSDVQVPRVQTLLRLTRLAYEAGEQPLSTVMEALQLVEATEQQRLEATHALRQAELAVAEAAGFIPGF